MTENPKPTLVISTSPTTDPPQASKKHISTPRIQRKSRRSKSTTFSLMQKRFLEKQEVDLEKITTVGKPETHYATEENGVQVENKEPDSTKEEVEAVTYSLQEEREYPSYIGYYFRDFYKVTTRISYVVYFE